MSGACCYIYYFWISASAYVRRMLLYVLDLDISIGLCQMHVALRITLDNIGLYNEHDLSFLLEIYVPLPFYRVSLNF